MSSTARLRCDVSSELCCPVAKLGRWAPPLVTRFADSEIVKLISSLTFIKMS